MKLIDKDAVVAEIEKWRDGITKGIFSIPLTGSDRAFATFEYEILGRIKNLLDTLEVKEVEKEPKCMFTKDSYTDEDRKVLCEDCEEKCEYSKKEEPVSEELEEACEQLAENARKHKAETLSPFFSQTDYKQGVIDGANLQKQIMMKDAIECQVEEGGMCPAMESIPVLSNTDMIQLPKDKFEVGDKVKLIIIKQ